jgi:triosephosphate isomerase
MKPIMVVNFKTYENGIGDRALKLAKTIERVAKEFDANIAVAVEPTSIFRIMQSTNLRIFSQHVDPYGLGPNTGHIIAESVKENGAYGVMLNHSEKKIDLDILKKCLKRCEETNLKTLVCVQSLGEAKIIANASIPLNFIALEDAELIGSGKSISMMMPDAVKTFAKTLKKTNSKITPLCGAGISTCEDVKTALDLGVGGVMVSSAVVNSPDPEKSVREMAEGLL